MHRPNPSGVEIIEVAPRDGLQNEKMILPTTVKVELIQRAVRAGARRIEACAFVNPRKVPAMADAEDVMASLPRVDGVSYSGLVLNDKGYERARSCMVDEINFVIVATNTFSQRNQGMSTADALKMWESVASAARRDGIRTCITIAAAFGCPFEGEVGLSRIASIVEKASSSGPDEISLADTIGVAAPTEVAGRIHAIRHITDDIPLRCHFHNTRNTGYANAAEAIRLGVQSLDSSVGGIGGCPFAPRATGNIATEDLLYMLGRMNISSGIDLAQTASLGVWITDRLGKSPSSMLGRVDTFPPAPLAE